MATRQKTNRFTVEQTVTWMALLGFVPFAFLTTLLLVDPGLIADAGASAARMAAGVVVALKVYSAIVLSFIGGIRWGIAIMQNEGGEAENETLVFAAGPALFGWFAFFLGEPWSFAVFAAAFAATGWWDSRSAGNKGVPEWFGRLRLLLTALVMVTMVGAFATTF
jgi:hypothetical protein